MRKWWVVAGVLLSLPFLVVMAVTLVLVVAFPSGPSGLNERAVPRSYQGLIVKYGRMCPHLTPARLAAQLYQESGFNPRAVSPVGAQGIAQFMPGTWPGYAVDGDGDGRKDPFNPADAIPAAARFDCQLAVQLRAVPGDPVDNMLAAYNAGPGRVLAARGVPAITETRTYVRNIRQLERTFTAITKKTVVPPSLAAAGAINFAQTKLGTPYLWGGEGTAAHGGRFDCSGLTQAAYQTVGITIPRVANDQWYAGPHVPREQLRPGDLVFFAYNLKDPRSIHHVGIYVGGGTMIHAPHTGAVIRFETIDQPDYFGASRPTAEGAAAIHTGIPSRPPGP